ncbi:MAG: hypothetical protein HY263_11710 [Chloroflexi bacterium]|nr:hypothetical protein [Chloroflexota bacterium]
MNERRDHHGHGVLPFLLIPATVMAVKAMHRHGAMRAHGWGPGAFGPGFGHRAWGGAPYGAEGAPGAEGRPEFRLPPRIESFLNAWHEQAHKAASEPDQSSEGPVA